MDVEPTYDLEQVWERMGHMCRAFHPGKLGVINYGRIVGVRANPQVTLIDISFMEGIFPVRLEDIVGISVQRDYA